MTKKKVSNKEISKTVLEAMDNDAVDASIQGTSFEFELKGVEYKVTKPNFGQKQKVYRKKAEKFSEYLQDNKLLLQKDLEKQLKERGIDLDKMQGQLTRLETEKQNYQLKLGEALKDKKADDELKTLRNHIADLHEQQIEISVERQQLMQFCLENQLMIFIYSYMTTLVAQKKVKGKWVPVWDSYEAFENSEDEDIVNKVSSYAMLVMKDEIQF